MPRSPPQLIDPASDEPAVWRHQSQHADDNQPARNTLRGGAAVVQEQASANRDSQGKNDASAPVPPIHNFTHPRLFQRSGRFHGLCLTEYSGRDSQFGSLSEKEKRAVTDYMQKQFNQILADKYTIVQTPQPGTALEIP
jgi:hypothetical protein